MKARRLVWGLALLAALPWPSARAADLTYLVHEPTSKTAHPPLIVLLHGSGADESDMIGLWSQLPDQFAVVALRAPFPSASGGYRWYRPGASARKADIAVSRAIIDRVVTDAAKRFDADPKRMFLAGFSQGAVMVYAVALDEPGRFRGAAVLSGALPPGTAGLPAGTDRTRTSFFVAHGTADERIPFAAATKARAALARLGAATDFHAYPGMRHQTGDTEIRDLSRWLSERAAGEPGAVTR